MLKVSQTIYDDIVTYMCVESDQINTMEFFTSNVATVLNISKYLCLIENSVWNVQLSPQSNTNCYFNIIKIVQVFPYKTNNKNSL